MNRTTVASQTKGHLLPETSLRWIYSNTATDLSVHRKCPDAWDSVPAVLNSRNEVVT